MQYYIPEDWNPHLYLCEKPQKLQNNTQMERIFAFCCCSCNQPCSRNLVTMRVSLMLCVEIYYIIINMATVVIILYVYMF